MVNLSKLRFLPIPAVAALVSYLVYDNRDELIVRHSLSGQWQQISAGAEHTCAVDREGRISCWGKAAGGRTAAPGVKLTGISAGGAHTCGLTTEGEAVCWGEDYKGSTRPPAGPFLQLSVGWDYTCGLKKDLTLACWGDNGEGQATPPSGKFSSVNAGSEHTCGVKTDETAVCWGNSANGQCEVPDDRFEQVVAGKCHSCGLRADGSVLCWGCNPPGQDTPEGRYTPPNGNFTSIHAGHLHLCGIRTDGTVDCWGHNALGESDDPEGTYREVSTGYFHTCGIKADGSINCWGWASHTTQLQANKLQAREIAHYSVALQRHTCPFEGLGLLYMKQGRRGRAAGHFEEAVKISPEREPRQYIYLAGIRIYEGRLAEAEKLLKKALTLMPEGKDPVPTSEKTIRRLLRKIEKLRPGDAEQKR